MPITVKQCLIVSCLVTSLGMLPACNKYQPTKDVWKGTKNLWNEYVSPPASIDYDEKGELTASDEALAHGMMGIDIQLARLEREMSNADKPPTRGWLAEFFNHLPWVDGFAGVKADGNILGIETPTGKTPKTLDFNSLLYADPKQKTRDMRCDVQQTPEGPEVMLATPLYDGVDFLGAVVAYFDMRALTSFVKSPEELVILSPYALLWPGKYDFGATPLAGIDWNVSAAKASGGEVSNANGSFVYQVRYLGNMPLIFAVVSSGNFPTGNGDPKQGLAFFPKRDKVGPPPVEPRKNKRPQLEGGLGGEAQQQEGAQQEAQSQKGGEEAVGLTPPGVRDAMQRMQQQRMEQMRRAQQAKQRRRMMPPIVIPDEDLEAPQEKPQIDVPSPFGPRKGGNAAPVESKAQKADTPASAPSDAASGSGNAASAPSNAASAPSGEAKPADTLPGGRPSPFGPKKSDASASGAATGDKQEARQDPKQESRPATLPDGRPSPFGPKN